MAQDTSARTPGLSIADRLFRATMHPAAAHLPDEGPMPPLDGATGWLNSPPLTAAGLRGKVVLVQFWTYTCVNWLRTLPYVRAWAGKYADAGLVVLGVHSPEFDFEHDPDNVRRAVKDLRIDHPVAVDNDFAIWRAFANHYWPALYFVDAEGRIRHHRFGEGEYEQSEMVLMRLLAAAGAGKVAGDLVAVDPQGVEVAADWDTLLSPENYVGYERTDNFASPGGAVLGTRHSYTAPDRLRLNSWALSGAWTVHRQAAVPDEPGARLAYRFHARDLNLVLAPPAGDPARVRVRLDGEPPGAAHGADADADGTVTVADPRLYQLLRQPGRVTERTVEITFLDPGVQVYAVTFG